MCETPITSDWAAGRGDKWSANLPGLEAMLMPVDEPLIDALQLDAACRIADIGCGGGGTTLEILRRAPGGSVVHGFDIAPAQVESARKRIPPPAQAVVFENGERAIAFEVVDVAAAMPPAELYDRLVSRFGIMFFSDPPAAFANLAGWLAHGGQFAFAVWGPAAQNPWMTSVREVVAKVIDLPPLDPDAPGAFRYGEADKLLLLLDRAGLGNFKVRDWRGTLPIGGNLPASQAAHFALASFSSFSDLLAKAGDEALNQARQLLTARFSRHERNNVVRMDACVHIVTGTRPV